MLVPNKDSNMIKPTAMAESKAEIEVIITVNPNIQTITASATETIKKIEA